tara:strand:- start:416 stop:889 length:474 start_codon:yes stop_codon:yes gene_type:complete
MKELSKKVVLKLNKKKYKLALAESCTGGLLANSITSISGSSKVFTMSLVTYSNEAKKIILKVPKFIIDKYGAVSKQCCLSMVNNLYKFNKSNICVSVTGIAGPNGGSLKKPVGLVYIGIKKGNKTQINEFFFKNKGRSYVQRNAVKRSLNLILTFIK